MKNEELATLVQAIGTGFFAECDSEESRYSKIVLMTDADVDGAHIQTLLLTFFYRQMRALVENGLIYIAVPPLYKVYDKQGYDYCFDEVELEQVKKKYKQGYQIQRYKGLGEMNAEQLWETTMDPKTRSLIKVTISDAIKADKMFSLLMGNNSDARKDWINDNVSFTLEEK